MARFSPALSVVVVAYDMARELPRTLLTLGAGYQRDIGRDEYEVVLIDNGSPHPIDAALLAGFDGHLVHRRIDPAAVSPAHAANVGVSLARGALVGLVVDGARMASPRLLATAREAAAVSDRTVTATHAFHLGDVRHMEAGESGHDQAVEDRLLDTVDWRADGYELFTISTFAGSSGRGWFGAMGESSALFMHRALWKELGGLDEAFALPGGGLVNHDVYRRACLRPGVQLCVLLGEATFHQFHGGAATSRRLTWAEMHTDYERLRGEEYHPPVCSTVYHGRAPHQTWSHLEHSASLALEARARQLARER